MSIKRTKKLLKRSQKKKRQADKQKACAIKKQKKIIGRLDLDRATPADQMLATMMSDSVPESEWHPDDVDIIKEELELSKKTTGENCSVKRRPDGSLTIMSEPKFEGFDDFEDDWDEYDNDGSFDKEMITDAINHGVNIGIDSCASGDALTIGSYLNGTDSETLNDFCRDEIGKRFYKNNSDKLSTHEMISSINKSTSHLNYYFDPDCSFSIKDVLQEIKGNYSAPSKG